MASQYVKDAIVAAVGRYETPLFVTSVAELRTLLGIEYVTSTQFKKAFGSLTYSPAGRRLRVERSHPVDRGVGRTMTVSLA